MSVKINTEIKMIRLQAKRNTRDCQQTNAGWRGAWDRFSVTALKKNHTWVCDLQPPEMRHNKVLLSHPVCVPLLQPQLIRTRDPLPLTPEPAAQKYFEQYSLHI